MQVGRTKINIIEDGKFLVDGGVLSGVAKTVWDAVAKADRQNCIRLAMNIGLIETPDANILIDTGMGAKHQGELREACGAVGSKLVHRLHAYHNLAPRDIDVVLLTQAESLHSGGATKFDRDGDSVAIFKKARYLLQNASLEHAQATHDRFLGHFFESDIDPLKDAEVLHNIEDEDEIIPGLTVHVKNGPSPGHLVVLMERGSERIIFAGDLIPTQYHLMLDWNSAEADFTNETLKQKRELIEMATEDGWLIVFGHGNACKSGYIKKKGGRAEFVPAELT